jgi:hypothetical protein
MAKFELALVQEALAVQRAEAGDGGSVAEWNAAAMSTLRRAAATFRTTMTPAELAAIERMTDGQLCALAHSIYRRVGDRVLARALDRSASRAVGVGDR